MGRLPKALAALILVCMLLPMACRAELVLRMVDVDGGECILINCDGEGMVVDTGYAKCWEAIQESMKALRLDELQYLVLTHPHADHIGAATRLIEQYPIEHAILPPIEGDTLAYQAVLDALEAAGIECVYPQVGEVRTLGNATITAYAPHPVAYANPNNWSIVLMIAYAGRRILLTGDIEAEAEQDLLNNAEWLPLQADILKVPHHGSDSSSTFGFIQAVAPRYALVSCGSEAYPHVETAMTLFACGVEDVFTTLACGPITLTVEEDGRMAIQCHER